MNMSVRLRRFFRKVCITVFLFSMLGPLQLVGLGYGLTPIEIAVNSSKTTGYNSFSIGSMLHGEAEMWSDISALRELTRDANFKMVRFFEHCLGKPCTRWDESTKTGRWDWSGIDDLVRKIIAIGAEPLIVLGFYSWTYNSLTSAPSGMSTNPNTGLPYPDQWGAYCASWVRHFKEVGLSVRYYEIINEPYHYFEWDADTGKLSSYMKLYNAAAKAMRAIDPKVRLGCDACILKKVLDYFVSYGEALDFLSYHGYGTGDLDATDEEILQAAETKFLGEGSTYYGVIKAKEIYRTAKGVALPVINSENNANYHYGRYDNEGSDPRIQQMLGAVYTALCIRTYIQKGFMCNIYYTFGARASNEINFGMVNLDNYKPWYPYYAQKMIGPNLAVGDKIVESTSSSDNVRVLAWIHGKTLNTLLICKSKSTQTVHLQGVSGQLTYQKIDNTISWTTPALQTGKISSADAITMNGYTVMLLQYGETSPTPTSIFKDGFEGGSFSAWSGTGTSSGETRTVVDTLQHHGTYSARFTSDGLQETEYAYCYRTVTSSTELYARGYFYVSQSGILQDGDRFYFIVLRAGSNNVAYAGWRRTGGSVKWTLLIKDGTNGVFTFSAASPSLNRWYCVELHWKKDGANGLGELWVDGTRVCSMTGRNTASYGDVNQVRFGLAALYYCQSTRAHCDCLGVAGTYLGVEGAG